MKEKNFYIKLIIAFCIAFSLYNFIFLAIGTASYFGKQTSLLILSPLLVLFYSMGLGYYSFFMALILFPLVVFLIIKLLLYLVKRFK